jgi:hypothetical protein
MTYGVEIRLLLVATIIFFGNFSDCCLKYFYENISQEKYPSQLRRAAEVELEMATDGKVITV